MKRLGDLESDVMDVLWDNPEPQTVHDIIALMSDRDLAYTTILTVVSHLYDKGWVERTKISRAYQYSPVQTREEATSQALRDILDSSGNSAAVLMHFARSVTDDELSALRRHLPQRKGRR